MKIKKINFCKLIFAVFIIICLLFSKKFYEYLSSFSFKNKSTRNYFELGEREQLLDLNNFRYIMNTDVCIYAKPKYIIIITSHVNNLNVRNIIRNTYPKDLFDKFNVRLIFLLGITYNLQLQQDVERENLRYKDSIQGNFVEAYRNLTYKHVMGLKWIDKFCNSVKHVIKMDDDIVVNFYKLFELIPQFKPSSIVGCVIKNMKPIRISQNKWYVTFPEYPNSSYPPFVSGWLYITTIDTVRKILHYSDTVPYFWIDDVYVTGILAKHAHIVHTDIRTYFRYDPDYILCCVEQMRACNFVAAPSGGKYDLHMKFNQHMWECKYKRSCTYNESTEDKNCMKRHRTSIPLKGLPYIYELINNKYRNNVY